MREPKYWGTWEGRVCRAIAEFGPLMWEEIRDITGLSKDSLDSVLSKMSKKKDIERRYDEYWLETNLYLDYLDFLDLQDELEERKQVRKTKRPTVKFSSSEQEELVKQIDQWRKETPKLNFSLDLQHFYLTGGDLEDFSKKFIRKARQEVLVVNPFVQKCNLSDTFREVAKEGKAVLLITQPPSADRIAYTRELKEKYHASLRHAKIKPIENNFTHAKIIVIDRKIAIISSMNFTPASTSGQSWEAGIVTIHTPVVEKVVDSIMKLKEEYESKQR
ncbi:MAG: phospholipase D-like domain-containing protein [Promethearchaeota archaeon]